MTTMRSWLVLSSIALSVVGCDSPGIVEAHRIPKSMTAAPASVAGAAADEKVLGECPSGWSCMDLTALGLVAMDGLGKPVTATCSVGAPKSCDQNNPRTSCPELAEPFCASIMVGGQTLVGCAQRCSP